MNYEPFTSIENPTLSAAADLVHFRHFIRRGGFSSLFTPSHLYICRESSTNQLLFMQNKPNLLDTQMNVSIFSQMDYENLSDWTIGQNKPNSNPIKPNFTYPKRGKTEVRCWFFSASPLVRLGTPYGGVPRTAYYARDCHLQACGRILVQSGIDSLKYVSRQTEILGFLGNQDIIKSRYQA